jgi:hypothetical protein
MKIPAPPSPLHPTDKNMVVALFKIMIHEYLFVVFFTIAHCKRTVLNKTCHVQDPLTVPGDNS